MVFFSAFKDEKKLFVPWLDIDLSPGLSQSLLRLSQSKDFHYLELFDSTQLVSTFA